MKRGNASGWLLRGSLALLFGAVLTGMLGSAPSKADDKQLTIMFLGNSTAEPFWQRIIKGFNDAGKDLGFNAVYRAPGPKGFATANDYELYIQNAIAAKPDGLIIADTRPEAVNGTIKQAVDAGIPVVLSNAGFGEQKNVGALAFVGLDETNNGFVGGQLLKNTGAKHALVVTLAPGIPLVDQRTAGFIDGFKPGIVTKLEVPLETLTDTPKFVNAASAALQKDPTIDSAFSIGSCCSPAMLIARDQLGDRANSMHFGTIDLGDPALQAIADHKLDFGLDQQQYMQGYLPALILVKYITYGITPGTDFIATGPGVITADNAAKIIALSAQTVR